VEVVAPAPDLSDDSEKTVVREEHDSHTHVSVPSMPVVVTITWDDGTVLRATSLTVVGRNPSVGDLEGARAVVVDDTTRSLSKTHFALSFEAGSAFLTDRHSTNGTTLLHESGVGISLAPGVTQPLST